MPTLDPILTAPDVERLRHGLLSRVIGQPEAVEAVVEAYQVHLGGFADCTRPVGSFLFLGPTGSGKTRLAEAVAETLVGDAHALVRIDCAEYAHGHEIAKLIGSPPGYLGHRETTALLCQEVLNRYRTPQCNLSFVLFDEIEKASDTLWNLLLGILDKATLTLGDNRRVDFSQSLIFMTSNVGSGEMGNILAPKMGFSGGPRTADASTWPQFSRAALEAAKRKFLPEFLNRITAIPVFHPLGPEELAEILELELSRVQGRIFASAEAFLLNVSPPAKKLLLAEGTDLKYGARPLRRVLERRLVRPLSALVATGQLKHKPAVTVGATEQTLTFKAEEQKSAAAAL
jgi:ATP-dependent Clp protease ATP-binding subunit ClpB